MWLGIIVAGLSTFSTLRPYFSPTTPNIGFMTSGQLLANSIDVLLQFFIAFALFGVVPAAIRGAVLKKRHTNSLNLDVQTGESEKRDRSKTLLPIAALALTIFAADIEARSLYPDTSKAKTVKIAREAVEQFSSEQRAAFISLKTLAEEWNQLVEQWSDLYENNIRFQDFGTQAEPVITELSTLLTSASNNQRLLVGTAAEQLFVGVIDHYQEKLVPLRGATAAITAGDSNRQAGYAQRYSQIDSRSQAVLCEYLRMWFASPLVGGLGDAELDRGRQELAQC
jgi:hypothetical protein